MPGTLNLKSALWALVPTLAAVASAQNASVISFSSTASGTQPSLLSTTSVSAASGTLTSTAKVPSSAAGGGGSASSSSLAAVTTTITLESGGRTSSIVVASSSSTSGGAEAASTAVPSPTAALNSTVTQLPDPPRQAWCNDGGNATYCPTRLLQEVELAGLFPDSKTFPDKPTKYTADQTFYQFGLLSQNATIGALEQFVENWFKGEGLELETVEIQNFTSTPKILDSVNDQIYRGFVAEVNSYWSLLIRQTNQSALCTNGTCDSSLIPLNNTIVVPGGRYREIYYWDSIWILEGLLSSQLYEYAWDLLSNFMDLIELYGFLPNGGRKYYLNRSQPPVFAQMVNAYVQVTGNTTVLDRALPVLEKELAWWQANRTINVTSPFTNQTYKVAHYNVNNSAPRPEGYVEDITTVWGGNMTYNSTQQADLYAEIASGAETGWDYSSRWCKQPVVNVSDNYPALRTLNTRAIIPVDLNSLLYGDHMLLADLYARRNGSNETISYHQQTANSYKSAVLDLMWDPVKMWFYDFNTTANDRSTIYHAGGTFPLWQNITPSEIAQNETAAQQIFAGQRFIADYYAGIPSVSTLVYTGLNWDFPNSWPPHVYTSIKALETLGRSFPNASSWSNVTINDFSMIPTGQLGLNQSELQPQPSDAIGSNAQSLKKNVAAIQAGKPWWQQLAVEYANRYMQATFCSWYSTGGSIPGLLESLAQLQPNSNSTMHSTSGASIGNMFEKFNVTDVDAAGGGGEYEVVVGFGWTNGVVLWMAGNYGEYLSVPNCPLIDIVEAGSGASYNSTTGILTSGGMNSTMTNRTMIYQGYRKTGITLNVK